MKKSEMGSRISTVVLISGSGTNLQAIIDEINQHQLPIEIISVVSDNPNAYGLKRAEKANIKTQIINYDSFPDRIIFNKILVQKIKESNPELIVLAGYMRILSDDFCHQFKGIILNIHPSLLPKYQGLNTYDRVLKSTDEYHGSTVHFVIPELDSGPIVLQYRTKIKSNDNPISLAKRVQQGEYLIYPMAIRMFAEGALRMVENQAVLNGEPITKVRIIE